MKSSQTAVELDFWPGWLGFFGVGELCLGRPPRGAWFLFPSGTLYTCLALAIAVPHFCFLWGYLPSAWGLGFCLLTYDICRLTYQIDEASGR